MSIFRLGVWSRIGSSHCIVVELSLLEEFLGRRRGISRLYDLLIC